MKKNKVYLIHIVFVIYLKMFNLGIAKKIAYGFLFLGELQ